MKSIVLTLILALLLIGCTPAAIITGATFCESALPLIGTFYNQVLAKKQNPETQQAATIILQQADSLAGKLKDPNVYIPSGEATAQAQLLADQAAKL